MSRRRERCLKDWATKMDIEIIDYQPKTESEFENITINIRLIRDMFDNPSCEYCPFLSVNKYAASCAMLKKQKQYIQEVNIPFKDCPIWKDSRVEKHKPVWLGKPYKIGE